MDWVLCLSLGILVLGLCVLMRKRFEALLAPFVCGLMLVCYALAIFGALGWLRYMALAAAVCTLIAVVWALVKNARETGRTFLNCVLTPGLLAFVVLAALCAALSANRVVTATDDIYYWGIEAKSIFAHGGLTDAAHHLSPRFMTYTPGVQLWQWLGLTVLGEWSEGTLYGMLWLGYAVFLLPLTENITWKKVYWLPVFLVAAALAPTVMNGDAYAMLRVDTLQGICLGYALMMAWTVVSRKGENRWALCCLSLALCAVVLMKQAGIGWAMMAALLLVICYRPGVGKTAGWRAVAALAAPVVVFISWKVVCTTLGLRGVHLSNVTSSIQALLTGTRQLGEGLEALPAALWHAFFSTQGRLPIVVWALLLAAALTVICRFQGYPTWRRALGWALGCFVAVVLGYVATLATAFYGEVAGNENIVSFVFGLTARYVSPYLFGMLMLTAFALIRADKIKPAPKSIATCALALVVALCANWSALNRDFLQTEQTLEFASDQFDSVLAENFWVDELEEPQNAVVLYGIEPYPFKMELIQYVAAPAKLVLHPYSDMDDDTFRAYLSDYGITHIVCMDDMNAVYQNAINYAVDEMLDTYTLYAVYMEDGEPVVDYP